MNSKLSKFRILLSFFMMILFALSVSGCYYDDDWARYERKSYEVSEYINADIYVISEIEPILSDIANEYAEGAKLVYAEYRFYNDGTETFRFEYKKEYEILGVGYTILVDLYGDTATKTITKVLYFDGIGKRVSSAGTGYVIPSNENVFDMYEDYIINMDPEQPDYEYVMISYERSGFIVGTYKDVSHD